MKISLKAKLEELGIQIKDLTADIAQHMYVVIARLANLTYNKAVEMTNDRLHGTRQDYINALHLQEEGTGIFVVYLDPVANHLEEGYPPFAMLPKLAQGPKSKVSKEGHRYVRIPMRQKMSPINPQSTKQKDFAEALKSVVKSRRFKKVKEGVSPKTGKFTTIERLVDKDVPKHLKGLTRVREYKKEGDKKPASSAYFTFRTASEKQDPNSHWFHPGFRGANLWPDLEKWTEQELDKIVRDFFPSS